MSWKSQPRPSFTHVSTHQTYVGKALYEHAPDCATIAAVACMSSSLLKSSLGPNLLALIPVDHKTLDLFDKLFLEYNPHMQLTQKLNVIDVVADKSEELIEKLKSNGPLLPSSLLKGEIRLSSLPLFEGFRALRSLTLAWIEESEPLAHLKSLPSLSELTLRGCRNFDAPFFKAIGDLENNRNFTSFSIDLVFCDVWCSEGFQDDFCGRLLSKNRLTKMDLNPRFWERTTRADHEAFVNAGMTNLLTLRDRVPAKLIRGEGFGNLRILSVRKATDEDLANIGNHCLFLEVLETGGSVTGSFLSGENLVDDAFKHLRVLILGNASFRDSDVGTGFSRLHSLEKLYIAPSDGVDGTFLQHLPNPDRLRSISFVSGEFSLSNLHRFANLEQIDLTDFQLSRGDILSFSVFKKLKRIKLSECGEDTASSEPFRILCPQLPKLKRVWCCGSEASRWTEEDVEAILIGCKWLRRLEFWFERHVSHGALICKRMVAIKKKYPGVRMVGVLQKNEAAKQESGSRREREE